MNEKILCLAYPGTHLYTDYAGWLRQARYEVRIKEPDEYLSGRSRNARLGNPLPNLVIQDANVKTEGLVVVEGDLSLTRRVVNDIRQSGKSISMLVVAKITSTKNIGDFVEVLRILGDDRFDYRQIALNREDALAQVKELLGLD